MRRLTLHAGVPAKMSLVGSLCAKGDEVAGKLIRFISTLAPIFLPKKEGQGAGGCEECGLGEFNFLS